MPNFGESVIVGRVPLSGSTELRVSTSSKDGKPCVDVRLFFADMRTVKDIQKFAQDKPPENFLPSRKGIFLEVPQFTELMKECLVPLYEKVSKL